MADTIRLYGLVTDSIVDGPGFRTAIFVQGCPYHCEGCHNPDSQPFEGGTEWTLDDVEKKFTGNPLLDGITLSGGEPAEQAAACAELAHRAHQKGLNVWLYSGSTYEKLAERAQKDADLLIDDSALGCPTCFLDGERRPAADWRRIREMLVRMGYLD